MDTLTEIAPLHGFKHLKRVRRTVLTGLPAKLEIILCQASPETSGKSLPDLPTELTEEMLSVVQQHGLNTRLQQVSRHPAATREQWVEWSKIWPLTFMAPCPKLLDPEIDISEPELSIMLKWMQLAQECALIARDRGSAENAALIVDPVTDTLVAKGLDNSANSPLQHSVMVGVEEAAANNMRRWPSGGSHAIQDAAASVEPVPISGLDARGHACSGAGNRLQGQEASDAGSAAEARQYLCTGHDCYVVQEPCAMCAMALVHSRVRRVLFCRLDPAGGALAGRFKLHAQRSLNHHFQVFHLPLALPPIAGHSPVPPKPQWL